MIKLIGTGIWICVVALVSVYFSIQMANKKESTEPAAPLLGGLETIRGEIVSLPVIAHGAVEGYFLTRLSYTVDPAKSKLMTVDPTALVTDVLYTELVGNQVIDIANLKQFDLISFKENVKQALNKRLGEEVFHDVIIEQIDFLSKNDIRANMRQGQVTFKNGDPVGAGTTVDPAAPVAEAAPAH
ncbi:hypothetical protein DFR52_11420 [Hoeflea marina]|uniref:Uncharacterized protein n=1 Tax=Hoeflea marina TaxID=274592 RepID=A0A317PBQ4_9HYPH|nr:hypothetical protein [Hoeflea marina]PWV95263.1 hypothetical protein DFR52_11420 [Hoeflea marina]